MYNPLCLDDGKKKFLLLDVQDVINIINEEEDWAIKKIGRKAFWKCLNFFLKLLSVLFLVSPIGPPIFLLS